MQSSLIEYVRNNIDPKAYFNWAVDEKIRWPNGGSEPRIICVFHADKHTPSLHINPDTGAWYCHGCEAGGNSIVSFHAKLMGVTRNEAAAELYGQFIRPTIDEEVVNQFVMQLKRTPSAQKYLVRERGLLPGIIDRYKLGYDGVRFTFPIRNQFGLTVNIKFYDPLAERHNLPKMVNYSLPPDQESRQFGSPPILYPLSVFFQPGESGELKRIVFCEGELDTLLMLSMGIPAVTMSAGVKSWSKESEELFRGLDVVTAYDNDEAGNKYAVSNVMHHLSKIAKSIKRLVIPTIKMANGKMSKDITDWWQVDKDMRQRAGWITAIQGAKLLVDNPAASIAPPSMQLVSLDQASQSKWFNKRIQVESIVTGKDTAPYLLPKTYRARCNKSCDECPLAEVADKDFIEKKINPNDPRVLMLIDNPATTMNRTLLNMAGLPCKPNCQGTIDVVDAFNIEQLFLIPTLESGSNQYVMRSSYYVGHGLHPNRSYRFEGTTIAHPQDQHTTHLFDVAQPVQDEIETFKLTADLKTRLKIFQQGKLTTMGHLMSIAEWQSRNVSKILERPDLHIAVDLVFHSVAAFNFNGEFVKRGMLDALIIGDTRCGKGYVTEGLEKFYRLGEIASGENCTFAGLIGGLQQIGTRWIITWGIIPLNHGRLVVVDEASSLSETNIRDMSRVRSEGVAEINKIKRESTRANTRLIWLSNTRSGRAIKTYNSGIQAIKELIGANEDISRFDFAMTVATDEVPSKVINIKRNRPVNQAEPDSLKFTSDLCRALILWAWSRKPEHIVFSNKATDEIIRQSILFGNKYSATIPLVQSENIRIKIAKLSAAVAARCFSTDESCELVQVESRHVECACEFLHMIYAKPSMGYENFSKTANAASETISTQTKAMPVLEALNGLGPHKDHGIDGLLQLHRITAEALADYVGDELLAKVFIGDLVKLHCLTRIDNWYLKNPSFNQWLRSQSNGHTTQENPYAPIPSNGQPKQPVSPTTKGRSRVSRPTVGH